MTNLFPIKIYLFFFLYWIISIPFLHAQDPTVGLIQYDEEVSDGYILFTPLSSESTFLIDNCGHKINEWDGLTPDNSNQAFMADDGTLIRSSFNSFQKLSWENEVLWHFDLVPLDILRHHDFHLMPNGNILFIASKSYSFAEIIERGRDPNGLGAGGGTQNFKVDVIYEIQPIGTDEAAVVWSWDFYDHLVQDFDVDKENFDEISNQPRRLDVNFNGEEGHAFDWLHCNGIDYNAALDQIIISSRSTCELYIIDHSTTTAEAATSTGGNYGFGGDFLWRWGNPIAYDRGTTTDQKLWEQHDPKFIPTGFPNEGMITVYNNLYNFDFDSIPDFSTVNIVDPNDTNGVYAFDSTGNFDPSEFHLSFTGEVAGNNMWSSIMSSTQAMSNGNLFISQGATGEMLEINQDKEIVWIYQNPVREFIYDQGSDPLSLASAVDIFIVTKYASNFPGFDNYDMIPLEILENENTISGICDSIVTNVALPVEMFSVYPNPAQDFLSIKSSRSNYNLTLYDLFGNTLLHQESSFDSELNISGINTGIYFLVCEWREGVFGNIKVVIE